MPLLVFGGGMHSTDDFQTIMKTFLDLDLSVIKILTIRPVVTKMLRELLYH